MKGLAIFGWLTGAFGAVASIMVLTSLGQQTAGQAAVRFIASAVLGVAGVVIARRARRAAPRIDAREAEQHILRVAAAHAGRLTATEVAAETPVPLAQASEMLEKLSQRGMCRMSIAEAGILVFEFPELEVSAPKVGQAEADGVADERRREQAAASQRTTE